MRVLKLALFSASIFPLAETYGLASAAEIPATFTEIAGKVATSSLLSPPQEINNVEANVNIAIAFYS